MLEMPKPLYVAQLDLGYQSSIHSFLFHSLEDAISTKDNLTTAIGAGASSFNIETSAGRITIFNLNRIQFVAVIDLVISGELNLKDILWQKYQEKLFMDASKKAEEILEETSFGIGR